MIPPHIQNFYIYFLVDDIKKKNAAFEKFYNSSPSHEWVKKYVVPRSKFWIKYMTRYSREIREMHGRPFNGVMTPRGRFG